MSSKPHAPQFARKAGASSQSHDTSLITWHMHAHVSLTVSPCSRLPWPDCLVRMFHVHVRNTTCTGGSHGTAVSRSTQALYMQVDQAIRQQPSGWKPGKSACTTNAVRLPSISRHLHRFRGPSMNSSPLGRRVHPRACTVTCGELLGTCAIGANALWCLLHWAADPGMCMTVTTTGAPHLPPLLTMF